MNLKTMSSDKKESKNGILNSLKKRLWAGSVTSISDFVGKGSKLKFKSKSSHCNLTSSDCENCSGVFKDTSTISVSEDLCYAQSPTSDESSALSEVTCEVSSHTHSTVEALDINGRHVGIQTDCIPTSSLSAEANRISHTRPSVTGASSSLVNSLSGSNSVPHEDSDTNENLAQYEELSSPSLKSGLTSELVKLSKYGWYWGPISKEEAEEKLIDQPDGAFLLRDSSADHFILSLSFRSSGKTLHTRIEYNLSRGLFSLYQQSDEGFTSIAELVEHSMLFSKSAVYCYSRPRSPGHPAFPVRLTKPVSRFAQVRSLQHLCRFVIRESIRLDNIQKLPLPKRIKGYIEEGHF